MIRPSVRNTLLSCLNNIPFYDRPEYNAAIEKLRTGKSLDEVILGLPETDGKMFATTASESFVPKKPDYYVVFQSSGTTGKPKRIYTSVSSISDYAKILTKMLTVNGVKRGQFCVSALPREPAGSGYLVRECLKKIGIVDMPLWPWQTIYEILKYADKTLPENSEIIVGAYASILLRNYYIMTDYEQKDFSRIIRKFKARLLVGGELINSERRAIIKNTIGFSDLDVIFGATEGIVGCESKNISDEFLLPGYNQHYLLKSVEGDTYTLKTMKGKTGELILNTKTRKGKNYGMVFLRYNTHDVFQVKDVLRDGSIIVKYLDRFDDIKKIGVARVTQNFFDEVIMRIGRTYGTKEWYAEITQTNGLDNVKFYVERGSYNGSDSDFESIIKKELRGSLIEFELMLKDSMVGVSAQIVAKEQIPFYKEKFKAVRIVDLRSH